MTPVNKLYSVPKHKANSASLISPSSVKTLCSEAHGCASSGVQGEKQGCWGMCSPLPSLWVSHCWGRNKGTAGARQGLGSRAWCQNPIWQSRKSLVVTSGVPGPFQLPRENGCGWVGKTKRQREQHKPISKEGWEISDGEAALRDVTC